MHQRGDPSKTSGASTRGQSSAAYTIAMYGFDFRQPAWLRRPRFLLRRKPGRRGDRPVYRGEREIIARN
jgi:hypothetical protein